MDNKTDNSHNKKKVKETLKDSIQDYAYKECIEHFYNKDSSCNFFYFEKIFYVNNTHFKYFTSTIKPYFEKDWDEGENMHIKDTLKTL